MIKRIVPLVLLVAFTSFSMVVLEGAKKAGVIAKVGRTKITIDQLNKRLAQFPVQSREFFKKKENKVRILDQLIDEELLYQYAKKNKLHRKAEYKDQINLAQRQLLISLIVQGEVDNKVSVNEEEMRAYYDGNRAQFQSKETRKLSHILLKTKKDANYVLKKLRGGMAFSTAAKKYSTDSSKDKGGDLGWVSQEQVVPAFGDAAFKLKKKGSRSGIVKSQFGYHIIRLNGTKKSKGIDFEDAKEQIYQTVLVSKRQDAIKDLLAKAKSKSKVSKDLDQLID